MQSHTEFSVYSEMPVASNSNIPQNSGGNDGQNFEAAYFRSVIAMGSLYSVLTLIVMISS